jgi:PAS domain S-box-containing protein
LGKKEEIGLVEKRMGEKIEKLIDRVSLTGFWVYVLSFTVIAVLFSESLIGLQLPFLVYDKETNLFIAGFITPLIDASILAGASWFLLQRIKKLKTEAETEKERVFFRESMLQAIFDNAPTPIFYKDRDGKYLGLNSSFHKVSGISSEYVEGKTVFDLFPKEIAEKYHTKDRELLENPDTPQIYETTHKNIGSGREFEIILHKGVFRNSNGEIAGIVGIITDITEIKKLERDLKELNSSLQQKVDKEVKERTKSTLLYKQIIDSSNEYFSLMDRDHKYLIVNNRYLKTFGVSESELIGKTPEYLLGEENYNKFVAPNFTKALKGEFVKFDTHLVVDGEPRIINIRYSPFRPDPDNRDSVEGVILAGLDITEDVRLKEKQKRQEQLLIQQSKLASMGEMIGAIAHQWRQPLSAITGTFINIEDSVEFGDFSEEYLREQIEFAEKNIDFMSRTIDDFRNFFSPSKNRTLFSLYKVIRNSISIVDIQFRNRGVKFLFLEESLDIDIYGYPNEFIQVLINIFSNSKDAIEERFFRDELNFGDGKIEISVKEKGDFTEIFIEDNGGGVPDEVINRVFEPYFTTKEQGKGTGIGLYMSKMIIEENMGGKLEIFSKKSGTVVKISLKSKIRYANY